MNRAEDAAQEWFDIPFDCEGLFSSSLPDLESRSKKEKRKLAEIINRHLTEHTADLARQLKEARDALEALGRSIETDLEGMESTHSMAIYARRILKDIKSALQPGEGKEKNASRN